MSYANGTTHYNLPQTLGTDKRDWFDTNQAFADVDAALYAASTGQAADAEAIVEINQKLVTDEQNISDLQTLTSTHTSQISTLQTTVNTHANQIADTRQDAEDMISAYNEGAAETSTHAYAIGDYFIYNDVLYRATAAIAIGDTIVPNTNCEATNVTTEIGELNSDLADTNNNLTNLETPFEVGVIYGSSSYTSAGKSFCTKENKRIFVSLEFTTSTQITAGQPIVGIDYDKTKLPVSKEGTSQAQYLTVVISALSGVVFTGMLENDNRIWLYSGSTIPADSTILIYGSFRVAS